MESKPEQQVPEAPATPAAPPVEQAPAAPIEAPQQSAQAPAPSPVEVTQPTPTPTQAATQPKKPMVSIILSALVFIALVVVAYYAYSKTK